MLYIKNNDRDLFLSGMKKAFVIISFLLLCAVRAPAFAENSDVSGFIPGQIWYSKSDLVEGDTVNIYTAVWNSGGNSLYVKVEFYDKNVILGVREATLSPSELKSISVPWKVTLGDHVISAKIISSSETISGSKEKVVLGNSVTENDRRTVKVTMKNSDGSTSSPAENAIKTQIDRTSKEIESVVPDSVSSSVSSTIDQVDNFRNESYIKVSGLKANAAEEVNLLKDKDDSSLNSKKGSDIEGTIEEPLAYIKLFLFSVATFVLGNKPVFYAILILLIFVILRAIYNKLRNRR